MEAELAVIFQRNYPIFGGNERRVLWDLCKWPGELSTREITGIDIKNVLLKRHARPGSSPPEPGPQGHRGNCSRKYFIFGKVRVACFCRDNLLALLCFTFCEGLGVIFRRALHAYSHRYHYLTHTHKSIILTQRNQSLHCLQSSKISSKHSAHSMKV